MKSRIHIWVLFLVLLQLISCKQVEKSSNMKIIFLHHSTGNIIWQGASPSAFSKIKGKIKGKSAHSRNAQLPLLFKKYNKEKNKDYLIEELVFPKASPYGWNNFPFDYYNIWVKHAGEQPYMEEPTLEILTKKYRVIIFKHCFPVCNIQVSNDSADINSDLKTLSNYKLQYLALRNKLQDFPDTKFILFTGAALVKASVSETEAQRAKEFFNWVRDEWDLPRDNIFLWDLYKLQTEDGLYFKNEYAVSLNNSHPNEEFSMTVVKLLFSRIIDVIENDGTETSLSGE